MKKIILLTFILSISLLCSCSFISGDKKEISPSKSQFTSPYTGEKISESSYNSTPFFAIVENSKLARPQSGLIDADIVFETMAEGGIPRFMALFHKNLSKKIGPIRSARPYFLDIASQFKLPFAHCGHSEEAKNMIEKYSLPSLNEFHNAPYYWREKNKPQEHSLYTSSEKIINLIKKENLKVIPKSSLKFDEKFWNKNKLSSADSIKIKVNKYYNTDYIFKDGLYYKSMDSIPSSDLDTKKNINTKNIVIQLTDITLQKDKLHVNINLVGKGTCYIISNGKFIKGTWNKSNSSHIILYDKNGNEIPLNKGNTWWHIINNNSIIDIQ